MLELKEETFFSREQQHPYSIKKQKFQLKLLVYLHAIHKKMTIPLTRIDLCCLQQEYTNTRTEKNGSFLDIRRWVHKREKKES